MILVIKRMYQKIKTKMKKIITLFTAILLFSCSKDNSGDGTLPITMVNLDGQWKYKSFVKANGTVLPYHGHCPTKTDYIEILAYGRLNTYNYAADCELFNNYAAAPFYVNAEGIVVNGNEFLFHYPTLKNFTANGFTIEYTTPEDLSYLMYNATSIKQLIFEKK